MSLNDLVKAETERLGFTFSGVVPITPPPHLDVYQRWVDAGLHASMGYLAGETARARRANPCLILPEALSMVVVALRYPSPLAAQDGTSGEASGRVASYAWGIDYHEIIPPLLNTLLEALQKHLGRSIRSRSYTDTGAILERDYAQLAGLGWAGKNTCLISPRHGSFFLLGETLVDIEIEPDLPLVTDHCGSCRRCIEACPTSAIRGDRTIDSGRCISYLTIENKGPIPPGLRTGTGDWIFGCDICQTVCPWNVRFASLEGHPMLEADLAKARPVLRDELLLTPQEFNRKFRRSPVLRTKRRGYLRNVAVAVGNQQDSSTVPTLENLIFSEPEPLIRGHAAWALGCMHTLRARKALEKQLSRETDESVIGELRSALDI